MNTLLTMSLLLAVTTGQAKPPDAGKPPAFVLSEALQSFDAGMNAPPDRAGADYRAAAAGFRSLIDRGIENGGLYYNLANTYFRLGDLGRAIVNYRRAQRLLPHDPNVRENLRFARSLCQTPIEGTAERKLVHSIFFWHFGTSARGRLHFAVVAFVIGWCLLAIRLFRSGAWLRNAAVTALALALVAGGSVFIQQRLNARTPAAVLVADATIVRKGNGETYDEQFTAPLSAGVEMKILETRKDTHGDAWDRVRFPDGSTGWVPASAVEKV